MSWPRRSSIFFLAAAAAGVIAVWAWPDRPTDGDGSSLRLGRGDLTIGAEVSGTLEAARSHALGPPRLSGLWSFEVSFLAPEGDTVRRGDLVLAFDTSELERTRQEKLSERAELDKQLEALAADRELAARDVQLQLAEARSKLQLLAVQLERPAEVMAARELREIRLDHQLAGREVAYLELQRELEWRRGRAQSTALEERRDRAAARVVEIEAQIERMSVRAPAAGTVTYVADNEGRTKQVGDGVWRSEKVVEIPDLSEMVARGQVEEAEAARIETGQPVTLRLDAHPRFEYRGRVSRVGRSVRRRSRTEPARVFRLEIALDETDPARMRPGMRFTGRVLVERVADVLLLPLEAVFPAAEGPQVWVARAGAWQSVTPRLGRRDDRHVEVLDGLRSGDLVSLTPRPSTGDGR